MSETEEQAGFCSYCGTENAFANDFCSKCGKKLPWSKEPSIPGTSPNIETTPAPAKKKNSCLKVGCLTLIGCFAVLFVIGLLTNSPSTPTITAEPSGEGSPSVGSPPASPDSGSTSTPPKTSSNSSQTYYENFPGYGKRQVGTIDHFSYVVRKSERKEVIGDGDDATYADGVFDIVEVVGVNENKKTHDLTISSISLVDSTGNQFSPSTKGGTALEMTNDDEAESVLTQLQPGIAKSFKIVYDVPKSSKNFKLKIPSGNFNDEETVSIKVPN